MLLYICSDKLRTGMNHPHIPTVVLLAQGDELTSGRTVDTNSPWLAKQLVQLGLSVIGIESCPDNPAAITRAIQQAAQRADFIVSTGGLGPTDDDYTTSCAATWANRPLEIHAESLSRIEQLWAARKKSMPDCNVKQATLPVGCTVLANDWGTAPGFVLEHQETTAFFIPGVPREMRAFWEHRIHPFLATQIGLSPQHRAVLRCIGVSESRLQEKLENLETHPDVAIHYKTKLPENRVILDAPQKLPLPIFQKEAKRISEAIGSSCLGVDTPNVFEIVSTTLTHRNETLSVAESCTGGQISAAITAIPGASRIFKEGACVYSNAAKIRTCGVAEKVIETHGAVSEEVSLALAKGIRQRSGSTYGIGVTGIAGPSGGSPDKPVGTVHVALATPNGDIHRLLNLPKMNRERVTLLTSALAIDLLRRHLNET